MPLHLTEYVRERLRSRGDPTLGALSSTVFHHRLLRCSTAPGRRPAGGACDRPDDDRYAAWLGAAFGARARHRTRRCRARRSSSGGTARLAQPPSEGLAKVLAQHFGVPVRIEQHVPQWLRFESDDRRGWARTQPRGGAAGTPCCARRRRHRRRQGARPAIQVPHRARGR
jgi:type VI secretion system protein ImpH